MYDKVSYTEVVACILSEKKQVKSIQVTEVQRILAQLRHEDPFLSVDCSTSAYERLMYLSDNRIEYRSEKYVFTRIDQRVTQRFKVYYYGMDIEVRKKISRMIRKEMGL